MIQLTDLSGKRVQIMRPDEVLAVGPMPPDLASRGFTGTSVFIGVHCFVVKEPMAEVTRMIQQHGWRMPTAELPTMSS